MNLLPRTVTEADRICAKSSHREWSDAAASGFNEMMNFANRLEHALKDAHQALEMCKLVFTDAQPAHISKDDVRQYTIDGALLGNALTACRHALDIVPK